MILDARIDSKSIGPLVAIYDAETGERFGRPKGLLYIDTVAGIYRVVARDDEGNLIRDDDGEPTWTEHSRRLRIEPHPDLDPSMHATVARYMEIRERDGLPTFEDRPPATLDEAMHEVKIEDACAELGLDEATVEFVLASYRFNSDLLHTILEHNGDHRCYVECKLVLWTKLAGEPEPKFPPRADD